MAYSFKYMPTFRARQQELLVLNSFDFGTDIMPLLEIIKAKDRTNNKVSMENIWLGYASSIKADKVLIDLPTYLKDSSGMQDEVLVFNRTTLSNIDKRIKFFQMFEPFKNKVIPVISSLLVKTGETDTITKQIQALRKTFKSIAVRTFTNTIESEYEEINALLTDDDILIYDLDTILPYNPLIKLQKKKVDFITQPYKVMLRSAINTEIQNVKLNHGEIIAEADNSLLDIYSKIGFSAFGDYVGVKKDDLGSGGAISPGFIFYDPLDDLYYGFKGDIKDLNEFERTIVPAVLNSPAALRMKQEQPYYLDNANQGWNTLLSINRGDESGKSQAKFKKIALEHYLHCMKVKIAHHQI